MKKTYRILVTGACGPTSRASVRSIQSSRIFKGRCTFIGTDICSNLYGAYEGLYDKIYYVPYAGDPLYRSVMQSIIDENQIEYAIIIPEPEVLYWSENPFPVKFLKIPPKFAKIALSKRRLYENLEDTGLTPRYQIVDKPFFMSDETAVNLKYPVWLRDYSEGTTSAAGAFPARDYESLRAWLVINKHTGTFMLSEYLPGRIFACFMLYDNGKLVKYALAERQEYIMAKVAVSGITGNITKGKMLNEARPIQAAKEVIERLTQKTGEKMNGLVAVDFREDENGEPKLTEINLRPLSFTSAVSAAGLNFPEIQLLLLSGQRQLIEPDLTKTFSDDNAILREVDGLPIYVEHFKGKIQGQYGLIAGKEEPEVE